MQPWRTLEEVVTADGPLALRQRGERDFLLTVGGRVLMSTAHRRSEEALARLAVERIAKIARPRVLTAGLGLGFTLRALLDALGPGARVEVAELHEAVVRWNRGPLAVVHGGALADPRVEVRIGDVMRAVGAAAAGEGGRFDAIVLDLMEGPSRSRARAQGTLYGAAAVSTVRRALAPGGIYAVWGEEDDPSFVDRLLAAGLDARRVVVTEGGPRHVVYVARPTAERDGRGRPLADGRASETGAPRPRRR